MRTLKNILEIVRKESPVTLARETMWRATRRWRTRSYLRAMAKTNPSVQLREVHYYQPDPGGVSSKQRQIILNLADEISQGKIPYLSYAKQDLGLFPPWEQDFISGKGWPRQASRDLVIVRFDGSDVKVPWELSRLQFLPVLGKAFCLTRDHMYRETAKHFVDDWIARNPVGQGVNWTVAMEVGLRSLSILFLVSLLAPFSSKEASWRNEVARSLWQHLLYIEGNLEFSHIVRGNHYLSDLVGLYGLAVFLEGPGMEQRRRRYGSQLEQEIMLHTYSDGGHFEASTGYHVLVSQLFLTAHQLMRAEGHTPAPRFTERLRRMFSWMEAVAGSDGRLLHVGDCDDGRVEFLFDDLCQMASANPPGRDSLRVKSLIGLGFRLLDPGSSAHSEDAPWFGAKPGDPPVKSQGSVAIDLAVTTLPDSGIGVMRRRDDELFFLAVPNGIHGKGSHTHNDKLSVVLYLNNEEVLCDPGTGGYTRDPELRNRLRSTSAHNTVMVDGKEQNRFPLEPLGLFSIENGARVSPLRKTNSAPPGFSAEHSGYGFLGVMHRRTVRWSDPGHIELEDCFAGNGTHHLDLHFQLGPGISVLAAKFDGTAARCELQGKKKISVVVQAPNTIQISSNLSQISRTYGTTIPAWRLSFALDSALPCTVRTTFSWNEPA